MPKPKKENFDLIMDGVESRFIEAEGEFENRKPGQRPGYFNFLCGNVPEEFLWDDARMRYRRDILGEILRLEMLGVTVRPSLKKIYKKLEAEEAAQRDWRVYWVRKMNAKQKSDFYQLLSKYARKKFKT